MKPTLADLGQHAARYYNAGMTLPAAAAAALDEAVFTDNGLTYPELYEVAMLSGKMTGFSLFYTRVTLGGQVHYRRMAGFTRHDLRPDDIANIQACIRLMVRVRAIRCLLRGEKARATATNAVGGDVAGYLSLKEVGLFCVNAPNKAGARLEWFLGHGDVTYRSLYHELTAMRTDIGGVHLPDPHDLELCVEDALLGCREDNHELLLRLATAVTQYYSDHTLNWDDDEAFGLPDPRATWFGRFWRAMDRH